MATLKCCQRRYNKTVLITAVFVVLCLLCHVPESLCKSVLRSGRLISEATTSQGGGGQSRLYDSKQRNKTENEAHISKAERPDYRSTAQKELMLVTVMAESSPAEKDHVTFWVDRTMAAMTVTVSNRGRHDCLLIDQFGGIPPPSWSSPSYTVWILDTPTAGQWCVRQEGEGEYGVRVEGSSSVDVEVTMYDLSSSTGLATLVHNSPTAGHQIRAIIDVIGSDVMKTIYNMSLVTSEGVEVASNWLRSAGGPRDPHYSSTFIWPTQAVYIRAYGEEGKGTVFERQTSFIITPILIDLQLQGGVSAEVIGPEGSLTASYQLINYGPPATFTLTADSDNDVLQSVVSPAGVRLGHQSSVWGTVAVSVPRYGPSTSGLLTVRVWSVSQPDVVQTASLFLTFPHPVRDLDPPTCQTMTLTGNCTPQDVTSPSCHLRHWRVQVSVEDDVSGLKNVTFADITKRDSVDVPPFEEGLTGQPLITVFRATCCKEQILLDTTDMAGNGRQCRFFRAEIPPPLTSPTTPPPETRESTTPPVSTQSADHVTNTSSLVGSSDHGDDVTTDMTSVHPLGRSVTLTANVSSSAILLNDTLATSHDVTPRAWGGKQGKGDHSTLTTASIILGSIGGCAGLCIAIICILLFCRHRRLLRHRNYSCDSQASGCSNETIHGGHSSDHNNHHRHDRSHRHYGNNNSSSSNPHQGVSSNRSSHHYGNNSENSHRHHSNTSGNSHRHHGSNNDESSQRRHSNSDNCHGNSLNNNNNNRNQRWRPADHHQRQGGNPDNSSHHHRGTTTTTTTTNNNNNNNNTNNNNHSASHPNSGANGSNYRRGTDRHRDVMPDVLPESESVTEELSTAL